MFVPGRGNACFSAVLIAMLTVVSPERAAHSQGAPPPAVTVKAVVNRPVTDTGTYIGRVVPIERVEVVARVPGFIEQRNFTEGQIVKKGELLFRIEQDTYKASVDQQAANLAKAKANEVNANLQLERNQALAKSQAVPQATIDQLAAAEQGAKADILQAQALLEQAQINLGYTEIRSPIDGKIGIAKFTVGKSGSTVFRADRDHRQPGPDLRDVSTERGRRSRLQALACPDRSQEPTLDGSYQIAGWHHLSASRSDQLPRRSSSA